MVACGARRQKSPEPCKAPAINGTNRCRVHAGRTLAEHRARGNVVVELRSWGLDLDADELRDPGTTLLQLVTQSAMRAELYASLLQQAYEAAERFRTLDEGIGLSLANGLDAVPHADNTTDRERAFLDLQRVFTTGGVGALIGVKWAAAGEGANLYQAEEAIRGLVALEAAERDRCANMAAKAVAAGLAERQVRLQERQGALVADAIRLILTDLGMTVTDPAVMAVVSTRLSALAGGEA